MVNIFVALTPLHFYFSYIIAQKLYSENGEKSLIIVKGNYNFKKKSNLAYIDIKYIKNEKFFEKVLCSLKYKYLFTLTEFYRMLKKEVHLFTYNFNDPITKNMLRYASDSAEITYVEEGIGSWNYAPKDRLVPERVYSVWIGEPEIFKKNHAYFQGEIKELDYRYVFTKERSDKFYELMNEHVKLPNCDYLYLGFPAGEMMPYEDETRILKSVITNIPDSKLVYIKKHPRDNRKKYCELEEEFGNVKVLDASIREIPIECLVWTCSIKCVISIISSSGFYLPRIKEDIKAIMLYRLDLMPKKGITAPVLSDEKGAKNFGELLDNSEAIYCPYNINELKNYLEVQD